MNNSHATQAPSTSELTPIPARKPLAEEAADRLRDFILLEKLKPGAQISEAELAKGLNISRTPIREAIFLLEIEGLVEYSSTRRPYVADPSLEMIAQNLSVLGSLEGLAGELACVHASDDEIAEIGVLCDRMYETSDTAEPLTFFRTDMAFTMPLLTPAVTSRLVKHNGITTPVFGAPVLSLQKVSRIVHARYRNIEMFMRHWRRETPPLADRRCARIWKRR